MQDSCPCLKIVLFIYFLKFPETEKMPKTQYSNFIFGAQEKWHHINGRYKIDRGRLRIVWEMEKSKNFYV